MRSKLPPEDPQNWFNGMRASLRRSKYQFMAKKELLRFEFMVGCPEFDGIVALQAVDPEVVLCTVQLPIRYCEATRHQLAVHLHEINLPLKTACFKMDEEDRTVFFQYPIWRDWRREDFRKYMDAISNGVSFVEHHFEVLQRLMSAVLPSETTQNPPEFPDWVQRN